MQLLREGSPPAGLRLPQTKLPRNSNQVARGRIRRFESDMPSQAVQSLWGRVRPGTFEAHQYGARAGLADKSPARQLALEAIPLA
jgi:hypothetical protein